MKRALHFFIIFTLLFLFLPPSFASTSGVQLHKFTISGVEKLDFGIGLPVKVHYELSSAGGYLVTKSVSGIYAYIPCIATVWANPAYTAVNSEDEPLMRIKSVSVTWSVQGSKYSETLSSQDGGLTNGSDEWKFSASDDSSMLVSVADMKSGVYYILFTVSVTYELTLSGTKIVTRQFSEFSRFNDIFVSHWTGKNDAGTAISDAFTHTFALVGGIWGTAGNQISHLDWGKLMDLDVLGFIEEIVNAMILLAYALFQTFVVPPTIISLVMAEQTDAMIQSMFVLAYVALLIASVFAFILLYKLIMLVKP